MVAYELYWHDAKEEAHFIGILPERRKKPERITKESVLNWGNIVIGDSTEFKDIFFTRVEI
jgi:hypothetical protein